MKYGYFKHSRGAGLHAGALSYNYNYLSRIPNIKIYYDYMGKSSLYFYKLLKKLCESDSLYITHIKNFGERESEIFKKIQELKILKVKLFIKDKEVDMDAISYDFQVRQLYSI